jgi:YidC/Oxa1 family membrane protein insertase
MDKNLFLAIALSIGVYAGWFAWVEKHAPRAPVTPAASTSAPSPAASASGTVSQPAAPAAPAAEEGPRVSAGLPLGDVEFTPSGAGIASYKYRGPLGKTELVIPQHGSMFSSWPDVNFKLVSKDDLTFAFEGKHSSGAVLRKTFKFDPTGWNTLTLELKNPKKSAVKLDGVDVRVGPGLSTVEGSLKDLPSQWRAFEYVPAQKSLNKLKPGKPVNPGFGWAGVDNRYFAAIVSPPAGELPNLDIANVDVNGKPAPLATVSTGPLELKPGESKTIESRFYFGPKDYQKLKGMGDNLQKVVDFGFFNQLGLLVYQALRGLHRVVGNWGWAIILLTVCIQGLTFPLTFKSLKAAASMRKLQPKIQAIQKRWADDPRRMNAEMMQLYKQSGTNPLGGCLPMLLQLPIFWALYAALRGAWELHGAPWMFWIHDLSAHDPYYVLPVLMGGIMWLQQKLSPAAPDPQQAQMMQFMPIMFTFMFLNFPTGLVLYWMTNSGMSLVLQAGLKRQLETE